MPTRFAAVVPTSVTSGIWIQVVVTIEGKKFYLFLMISQHGLLSKQATG
jgi:hypothetical protein